MQSAIAELDEFLHLDDNTMTGQGPDAMTNSHELGAINRSQSNDRKADGYDTRRSSERTGWPEPAVIPRSRLRMFAVMAALFVSPPLPVCSSGSQVLT
jgi:hypothetical protein